VNELPKESRQNLAYLFFFSALLGAISGMSRAELHYAHENDCQRMHVTALLHSIARGPNKCPATRMMCYFVELRVWRCILRHKSKPAKEKSKLLLLSNKRAITTASGAPPFNHAPMHGATQPIKLALWPNKQLL
jgi:hypothetical protein